MAGLDAAASARNRTLDDFDDAIAAMRVCMRMCGEGGVEYGIEGKDGEGFEKRKYPQMSLCEDFLRLDRFSLSPPPTPSSNRDRAEH